MTVEKVVCDHCGKVQGEANHWSKVGVLAGPKGEVAIELGHLFYERTASGWTYVAHDLCGERCFFLHISKLLKINPVSEEKI